MPAKVGLGLSGSGMTPPEVVECVKLADDLGYHSAWLSEGHGGDPFSTLTACALATKNILLGTSITSVFVRSAPTIALGSACVDHFSNGRFILGLGSSHRVQVVGEHGLEYSRPVQRLKESVEIIRALLRDGEAQYKGEILDIERFDLWFRPLRSEIPVYLAAVFPKMLRLCGEMSQGAILTWATLDNARNAARLVAEGAMQAGRDPSDVEVASLMSVSIATNGPPETESLKSTLGFYGGFFPRYNRHLAESGFPDEAAALRRAYLDGKRGAELATLVPDRVVEAVAVLGTVEQCREQLEQYREAGITLPIVTPRESSKQQVMQAIRALAP